MKNVLAGLATLVWLGSTSAAAAAEEPKFMCCGHKVAFVFMDAGPEMKLVVILLLASIIAAIVCGVLSGRTSRDRTRALSFFSGVRTAGPLLGAAGASYVLLNAFVKAMFVPPETLTLTALSPAYAEAMLGLFIGMLAGCAAALCHARLTRLSLPSAR